MLLLKIAPSPTSFLIFTILVQLYELVLNQSEYIWHKISS